MATDVTDILKDAFGKDAKAQKLNTKNYLKPKTIYNVHSDRVIGLESCILKKD